MEKKWNEFLEQMKNHQKFPNKNQLLLIFLCGLLLLVIVWPVSDPKETTDFGTEHGLLPGKGETMRLPGKLIPKTRGTPGIPWKPMGNIWSGAFRKRWNTWRAWGRRRW